MHRLLMFRSIFWFALLFPEILLAQVPLWWRSLGVMNDQPANDFAPITRGQFKNIVSHTYYFNERILRSQPSDATTNASERIAIDAVVKPWTYIYLGLSNLDVAIQPIESIPSGGSDNSPITLGELRRVATPFYARVRKAGYPLTDPWSSNSNDWINSPIANIGQVKRVFAPLGQDTDDDSLPDWAEVAIYGTSIIDADTDDDDLNDYGEVFDHGTLVNDSDTDDDGLNDGYEVLILHTNPLSWDSDADGLDDSQELANGTDPNDEDSDEDGLIDGEEIEIGTNPNDADSDDDGVGDGFEVLEDDTDPEDPNDFNDANVGSEAPSKSGKPFKLEWQSATRDISLSYIHPDYDGARKMIFYSDWDPLQSLTIDLTAFISFPDLAPKFDEYGFQFPRSPKGNTADFARTVNNATHSSFESDGDFVDSARLYHRRYWLKTSRVIDQDRGRDIIVYTKGTWYSSDETPNMEYSRVEKLNATVRKRRPLSSPIDIMPVFVLSQNGNHYPELSDCFTQEFLPVQFSLRDEADFEKGWDNITSDIPFTCVGEGKENKLIKFVGFHNDFEIIPAVGSEEFVSVSTEFGSVSVVPPEVLLTITGNKETVSRMNSAPAQIIFRKKGETDILCTLNVDVLPERHITFNVFGVSDSSNPNTAISSIAPTAALIADELKKTYELQANIIFTQGIQNQPVTNCAGGFDKTGTCWATYSSDSMELAIQNHLSTFNVTNRLNLVIVKNVEFAGNDSTKEPGATAGIARFGRDWGFFDQGVSVKVATHEVGHCLRISTVDNRLVGHHENLFDPTGGKPLMWPNEETETKWMRRNDWIQCNKSAARFTP